MAELGPGDEIEYEITYLEMPARPTGPMPPLPAGVEAALIGAHSAPADWFLYLYGQVGTPWEWTDWFRAPRAELEAFVGDERVSLYTLMTDGWPGGFFMLDTRFEGICDLAYFGLVPEATGRRLGPWLLGQAILMGWERPGVEKLSVNTCTLDHPKALALYQRMGFVPVDRERARRRLTRPRTA